MKTRVSLKNKTILVTGSAGFIGFYLTKRLLEEVDGVKVIGFDSVNDYYDVKLKEYRLDILSQFYKVPKETEEDKTDEETNEFGNEEPQETTKDKEE